MDKKEIIDFVTHLPIYYSIPLAILLWALIAVGLYYFMKNSKPYINYFLEEFKKQIGKIKEIEKKRKEIEKII